MPKTKLKEMPDDYWKDKLTAEQYEVLRNKGTEKPFTGKYLENNHSNGTYTCVACGQMLFDSNTKFESGTGWPSFTNPVNLEHVELLEDTTHGMKRTEVTCSSCGAHLGHVFPDGPAEQGGQRYCINSVCLDFKPKENQESP